VTATAYTALGLILAGLAAYAARDRISTAITRARWARHCRGKPPVPGDGKGCLSDDEFLASLIIELRWDRTAPEPERSS
jgi:hypothetical protein